MRDPIPAIAGLIPAILLGQRYPTSGALDHHQRNAATHPRPRAPASAVMLLCLWL